jgi:hypothetical protein
MVNYDYDETTGNYYFYESGLEAAYEPEGEGVETGAVGEMETGAVGEVETGAMGVETGAMGVETEAVGVETEAMEDEAANVETEAAPSLKRSVDSDVASQGSPKRMKDSK